MTRKVRRRPGTPKKKADGDAKAAAKDHPRNRLK
jgi:hypothetical protein